jgi:hypothetical protein
LDTRRRLGGATVVKLSARDEGEVRPSGDDVEDECGGLSLGEAENLLRPFEQHSADRSGLGSD